MMCQGTRLPSQLCMTLTQEIAGTSRNFPLNFQAAHQSLH